MDENQEEKGFTVRDRRAFSTDAEPESAKEKSEKTQERPADKPEEAPKEETVSKTEAREPEDSTTDARFALPKATFSDYLVSFFFTQTLMFLGEVPHPDTQRTEKNLPMAKYLIDVLAILKEKTKGNLTDGEQKQLDTFLTELRMLFVKASGK